MIMMTALTLAGENLFRECCNLAGKGAFHYEIWITFSGFLADGIKDCDHLCQSDTPTPDLWRDTRACTHYTGITLEGGGCQIPMPSV